MTAGPRSLMSVTQVPVQGMVAWPRKVRVAR